MANSLAKNLAQNTSRLRLQRELTQSQLARIADIPRSTLTHIESGSGNPSLKNLHQLASALRVSIEELLSDLQPEVRHLKAEEVLLDVRPSGATLAKLLPTPVTGMEIDRIELSPAGRLKGTPHLPKTREYFHCILGKITIYVLRQSFELKKGDVLSFPGDEPHAYQNMDTHRRAAGIGVVVLN